MSSKQDRAGVRTAQDLEQKYNLSSIVTIKKAVEKNAIGLESTNNELNNFIEVTTKNLEEIQNQVDGNLTTWFYSGVPTTTNPPANEWTTYEEKAKHVGDLYYDKDTGYAYRWFEDNGEFSWTKMSDSDVTEALAIANAALDTADSKRRVFVVQPTTPYDVGDIWFRNNEDLYRCATARESGAFDASDFVIATKYTDDTVANEAKAIASDLKTTVETHYVTNAKLDKTKDSINSSVEKLALQVDEKNKVFTTKPKPPYYVGDVYVLNDKIYYCTTERTTGSYTESDWELSVDAGTLVSKTEFNQTSESLEGSVNTLNNDYQATKTTRKQVSGNPTYISDSGGYALEKDFIYGMSIQETTNGYQLVDFNSDSNFPLVDDTITITKTGAWGSVQFDILEIFKNNPGKTMYFSCESYDFSKANKGTVQLIYKIGTETKYSQFLMPNGTNYPLTIPSNASECTYAKVGLYCNNSDIADTEYSVSFTKPMLSFTQNAPYEKYTNGASPNPQYPSEITNNRGIENLIDIPKGTQIRNGVEVSVDDDYVITLNGTCTTDRTTFKFNNEGRDNFLDGIYTLHYQYISGSISGTTSNCAIQIQETTNWTGIQVKLYNVDNKNTKTLNNNYKAFNIRFDKGAVFDNYKIKVQLEKGKIKHTIVPFGNHLVQKITGKNIVPTDISMWESGQYGTSGNKENNTSRARVIDLLPVSQDTYFARCSGYSTIIRTYDKNKNFVRSLGIVSTFTINENEKYIGVTLGASSSSINFETYKNGFANGTIQPFICLNSEKDKTFEPYKETLIRYDLQGNELCKIGNIKDKVDFVSGVLTKRIGKVVLNGSENWNKNASYEQIYYTGTNSINDMLNSNTNAFMSDYYTYYGAISSSASMSEVGIYMWWNGTTNFKRVNIKHTEDLTLEEFKTWLSENPVEVYYILAEPQTIQLEPTEITLYKGINNIYTESNVDVEEVDITYLTDSILNTQYATKSEVKIAEENITSSINSRIDDTALNLKQELNTSFQLTAKNITSEVASTYATNDELGSLRNEMSTRWTQTNNTFEMQFKTLNSEVSNIDQLVNTNQATLEKYIRFIDGALELGNNESPISLKIENDMLAFYQNDTKIAYISNNKLYITDGFFTNSLRIDSFGFFKEDNGSLSFGKVG